MKTRPESKQDLIEYVKIKLGHPLIQINVSDDQFDAAIEDAVSLFEEYHFDATEESFIASQITSDEISNGFIIVPEEVRDVISVLRETGNLSSVNWVNSSINRFQLIGSSFSASGFGSLTSNSIQIALNKRMISENEKMFSFFGNFNFNHHSRKLKIFTDWTRFKEGEFLVYQAMISLIKTGNREVWNNDWLKRYATALVQLQWGNNLIKFRGGKLFGENIELNADAILNEAKDNIEKLKIELLENYSKQPDIMVG